MPEIGGKPLFSIGKLAARDRLARELMAEVLAECRACGMGADHTFHTPASECQGCKAPDDHHEYAPWELIESSQF